MQEGLGCYQLIIQTTKEIEKVQFYNNSYVALCFEVKYKNSRCAELFRFKQHCNNKSEYKNWLRGLTVGSGTYQANEPIGIHVWYDDDCTLDTTNSQRTENLQFKNYIGKDLQFTWKIAFVSSKKLQIDISF